MATTPVNITGATTMVGFTVTPPFATTDIYTFSFPYLSQDDFEITVNSETILDPSEYEFTSDYLIQLTSTGVANLTALYGSLPSVPMVIRRRTTLDSRLVDFRDGATLTEADLDLSSNQLFYLIQEIYDTAEIGNVEFNPIDGSIDFNGVIMVDVGYPNGETAAATLGSVFDNVVTPDYTEGATYRTGRLVFNGGDLLRANTDIIDAPASINLANFDTVLTAAQVAQIATNTEDIATNTEDIATNAAAISANTTLANSKVASVTGTANAITVSGTATDPVIDITDNPIIGGTDSMVLPKGGTGDRVSTTDGAFRFNTDLNRFEGYKSGAWSEVGGGSGGLDTFHTETFEVNDETTFTTGQNAAPDAAGTGTIGGVLDIEESTPISDSKSLKFTMHTTAASSDNDFFIIDTDLTVDEKQTNNDMGVSFYYSYDGASGDIKFIALDQDDNVLTDSLDTLDASSGKATRFSTSFYVPDGTTGLRYGFQVVTGNSSKVLLVDDLESSMNPFVYKNLTTIEEYRISQTTNAATNIDSEFEFNLATASVDVNTAIGFEVVDDSANTRTKINISRAGLYTISFDSYVPANRPVGIAVNGTILAIGSDDGSANVHSYVSLTKWLVNGDYVTFGNTNGASSFIGTSVSTTAVAHLSVVAMYETEHVVTPAKSNLTDWESFTPTGSWTTNTTYSGKKRQVGTDMEYDIYVALSGAPDATQLTINLPDTIDTSKLALYDVVNYANIPFSGGVVLDSGVGATHQAQVAFASTTSVRPVFGTSSGAIGTGASTGAVGHTTPITFANGDYVHVTFKVPIVGLTNNVSFLGAVPVQKVAYINTDATNVKSQVTATTAYKTHTLNSVDGDSFLSIGSNILSLSAGKYELAVQAGGYNAPLNIDFKFVDSDTGTYTQEFLAIAHSGAAAISSGIAFFTVEIPSAVNFEFQTKAQSASGFEYLWRVKVTKLK